MSLPDGLLGLARDLIDLNKNRPRQATLRRAVSTAYYALFHLLLEDLARLFSRESDELVARLARSAEHRLMKEVSGRFIGGKIPEGLGPSPPNFIPEQLKRVAKTFVDLQKLRHDADYDRAFRISNQSAAEAVGSAEAAFKDWSDVSQSDAARLYLGCFLLWDTWNKLPLA